MYYAYVCISNLYMYTILFYLGDVDKQWDKGFD